MKKITEQDRKKLLDQLRANEKKETEEREEKKNLLDKISQIQQKIIHGENQKKEYLAV